ncbi:hypothetical protein E2562_036602 [Oryza meyeriana var. granulata]|uniref:Secreted protein n=1 Tax=Oryza meyeriana var. granulata TaxID=110450 RepID=A0A6G1D9R2_9ORYZ|nr:hypothetical protein E2562_036602 [Oryza meyeriana var. granulata]
MEVVTLAVVVGVVMTMCVTPMGVAEEEAELVSPNDQEAPTVPQGLDRDGQSTVAAPAPANCCCRSEVAALAALRPLTRLKLPMEKFRIMPSQKNGFASLHLVSSMSLHSGA